jgi:hypothetical protein
VTLSLSDRDSLITRQQLSTAAQSIGIITEFQRDFQIPIWHILGPSEFEPTTEHFQRLFHRTPHSSFKKWDDEVWEAAFQFKNEVQAITAFHAGYCRLLQAIAGYCRRFSTFRQLHLDQYSCVSVSPPAIIAS